MGAFLVKRLMFAFVTLFAVLTLVFIVIRIVPGDPALVILGDQADAAAIAALQKRLGIDRPLFEQYISFLAGALRGDWGTSLVTGRPVLVEVMAVLPWTLELTAVSLVLGAAIGVPLGAWAAINRNRMPDYVTRILSLIGLSFPPFVSAILLLMASRWPCAGSRSSVPIAARHGNGSSPSRYRPSIWADHGGLHHARDALRHAGGDAGGLRAHRPRQGRAMAGDRVATRPAQRADPRGDDRRALPLDPHRQLGADGDRLQPARPGKLIIGALSQRDYMMLQGMMVIYTLIVVVVNMLTDIVYAIVDPRVKLS